MPADRRMTLTELARQMQISPATVSKALSGRKDVSEQTRRRRSGMTCLCRTS